MSKNIKEIGKELLGKSLNSFHKKTGLPQLEKNNEMQDGILNGILSQVDDAYIKKTEQSNVIHLDGSGDGVVVLDSIEGNTMVNHINSQSLRDWKYTHNTHIGQYANTQEFGIDWSKGVSFNCWLQARNDSNPIFSTLKPNTNYTVWINILENNPTLDGVPVTNNVGGLQLWINGYQSVRQSLPINTTGWVSFNYRWTREDNSINYSIFGLNILGTNPDGTKTINGGKLRISKEVIVLEGLNTPLNKYFEGIQSSFEEKVNDEGKYEIEILSKNKSLIDWNIDNLMNHNNNQFDFSLEDNAIKVRSNYGTPYQFKKGFYVKEGEKYTIQIEGRKTSGEYSAMYMGGEDLCYPKGETYILVPAATGGNIIDGTTYGKKTVTMIARKSGYVDRFNIHSSGTGNFYWIKNIYLEKGETVSCIPHKSNKIKLLLNEPLRAVGSIKDRLCVKDGKLMIERNIFEFIEDGSNDWNIFDIGENRQFYKYIPINLIKKSVNEYSKITSMSNNYGKTTFNERGNITSRNCALMTYSNSNNTNLLCIYKPLDFTTEQLKTELNNSPLKMCYQLAEPYYEEVNNEYGEPIILEGYENGTLYIDSTIIPTTTVSYTPKMETLNTLKEVYNNNVMLTSDVNDNIIPYMMEVDLMIMEKEMALPSQINNRKVEVLDMTSMQKRTQEMLERLIKGKTLTEQECKTRVTTYLNAGKITDEQAEELMLVISEIYN